MIGVIVSSGNHQFSPFGYLSFLSKWVGVNIPIDRRAQALRPYSNGFCPQCRGELRSPKRYIIKAQVPY
ncbi:MAG: hypothetical protein EWV80_16260 [Microcystis aeruginosa Ma_QC_B_20070730_S2]|uniref:Uncharacterized protein n=1 Tax=Microcystis aeruginosa Ma_QC_B_20070730_S2 TaxID=2486256 RepID=A0A552DGG5_MICAE|nr:MAG: hypothetical protein EWV80_16260 [Microcystis aeruginosa Ma_QC_B_20070730_S2]